MLIDLRGEGTLEQELGSLVRIPRKSICSKVYSVKHLYFKFQ